MEHSIVVMKYADYFEITYAGLLHLRESPLVYFCAHYRNDGSIPDPQLTALGAPDLGAPWDIRRFSDSTESALALLTENLVSRGIEPPEPTHESGTHVCTLPDGVWDLPAAKNG